MDKLIIENQELSDGSIAYNVIGYVCGVKIRFACVNRQHANALLKQLERVSWAEFPVGLPA